MVTMEGKVVLRLNKINPTDRVFYTLDGTEPTPESPEFIGQDIESYSNVRIKVLAVDSQGVETRKTFPIAFVKIPSAFSASTTELGYLVVPEFDWTKYSNPVIDVYDSNGELVNSVSLTGSSASVEVMQSGVHYGVVRADNTFSSERVEFPEVTVITPSCTDPIITVDYNYDDWTITVTITGTEGQDVYYTIDGSDPTKESGILYESPFEVQQEITVKARAFRDRYNPSNIVSREISTIAPLPTPVIALEVGMTSDYQVLRVSNLSSYESGVEFRYTTNGAIPTQSDLMLPTAGLVVRSNMTLSVKAFKGDNHSEEAATATVSNIKVQNLSIHKSL